MRVAVTTIALNEVEFVERWALSASGADYLVLVDTGSTDGTAAAAAELGAVVHHVSIEPWRFDDARNAGMALLPDDVDAIITLDMDEILVDGWRDRLEEAPPGADRYSYSYVWSWLPDGRPDVTFQGERCVSRHGWRWKHPIHETLQWCRDRQPVRADGGFEIHHHADNSKPRSQYLPLLRKAAQESPHDDRIAHYYARELFFRGEWEASRKEFMRHLSLPTATWRDERAQSYRYLAKMDYEPERWLLMAAAEAPHRREPWVDLATLYRTQHRFDDARSMVQRALSIPASMRTNAYLSESSAWDDESIKKLAL
jgi:glycosyltransferase involved in cell wall biosynthesis